MKIRTLIIAGIISIFIYSLSSCGGSSPEERAKVRLSVPDTSIKRGAYLVTIMGCNDCHSPMKIGVKGMELDPDRLLSGYDSRIPVHVPDLKALPPGLGIFGGGSFTGPWGTSFASNITSDGTGIGNWSFSQFKKALTEGRVKGVDEERLMMPPMPWQNYQHIEEADLKAIFAYLKSTKPVNNKVPAYIPPAKAQ